MGSGPAQTHPELRRNRRPLLHAAPPPKEGGSGTEAGAGWEPDKSSTGKQRSCAGKSGSMWRCVRWDAVGGGAGSPTVPGCSGRTHPAALGPPEAPRSPASASVPRGLILQPSSHSYPTSRGPTNPEGSAGSGGSGGEPHDYARPAEGSRTTTSGERSTAAPMGTDTTQPHTQLGAWGWVRGAHKQGAQLGRLERHANLLQRVTHRLELDGNNGATSKKT